MKRVTEYTAIAGLFLCGVGMIALVVQGRMGTLSMAHFGVGGGGILLFLLTHLKDFLKTLRSRTARFGAMASVYVLVFIAILVVINAIGVVTSTQVADLTENSLYTLSPQTLKVLDALKEKMTIRAFFNGGRAGMESLRPVDRMLRTFLGASRNIELIVSDPLLDPLTAEKYGITQSGTLILEYQGRKSKINTITEQSLTNSIIRLLDDRPKVACFTTGHGEPDVEGPASAQLVGMGEVKKTLIEKDYQVRVIELSSASEVPPDCTVVLVVGPKTSLTSGELVMLDDFLQLGGRVFLAADAGTQPGFEPLLQRWGIHTTNEIVIEKLVEGTYGGGGEFTPTTMKPSMTLTITDYEKTYPITQDLGIIHPTQYFGARPMEPFQTATKELKTVPLMRTKKDSWAETDIAGVMSMGAAYFEPSKGDRPGPLMLAVASSMATGSPTEELRGYSRQARLIAVGNVQWLTNRFFLETQNFNPDLFINMVGWLAGFEQFLQIGPRSSPVRNLALRPPQQRAIFNVTVVFIPELILLLGSFVWWVRR